MDWIDRIKDDVNSAALWVLASLAGLAVWIVRTVLTDRARVDAIEGSIGEIQKNVRLLTGAMLETKSHDEADK